MGAFFLDFSKKPKNQNFRLQKIVDAPMGQIPIFGSLFPRLIFHEESEKKY